MSKHHQASRRRTYGRRQHELHERTDRAVGLLGWIDAREHRFGNGWLARHAGGPGSGEWLDLRRAD